MMCLIHQQVYGPGEFCPYCGPPPIPQIFTTNRVYTCLHDDHWWVHDSAGTHCQLCGRRRQGFTTDPSL